MTQYPGKSEEGKPEVEQERQTSRREALAAAGRGLLYLSCAPLLGGCGSGGGTSSAVQTTGGGKSGGLEPNEAVFVYAHQQSVGTSGNQLVGTMMDVSDIGGTNFNAVYWGVKDSFGDPIAVTQAAVWQTDPNQSAQLIFDASGRPSLITDTSGAVRITFDWQSDTALTLTVSDTKGNPVGGSTLTFSGDTYTIQSSPFKSVTSRPAPRIYPVLNALLGFVASHRATRDIINDLNGTVPREGYILNQVHDVGAALQLSQVTNVKTLFTAALMNPDIAASGSLSALQSLRPADSVAFSAALAKIATTGQSTLALLKLLGITAAMLDTPLLVAAISTAFLLDAAILRANVAENLEQLYLIDGTTLTNFAGNTLSKALPPGRG
ncbi:MAG TPA: hypothetical protein VKU00_22990 [Chthonomonadaceae bacterium]|nr:hypothetical protein [Chthonomonadaceae bacterium]